MTRNVPWTRIHGAVRAQVFGVPQWSEPPRQQRAMLRSRQIAVVPLLVVATTALCWAVDSKSRHKPADSTEEVQLEVVPANQEQVAPRLTPEQMPARPPRVSYSNGQLLVVADNSTLADILSAVSSQTGAVIDVPPGSGGERVAGRVGPGPARDVLAALLNGSQFDYIIVASLADPAGVEHVVLVPNTNKLEGSGPIDSSAIAMSPPNQQSFQQIASPAKLAPQQDEAEDTEDDSDQPITEQISAAQDPPPGDGMVVQPSAQQLSPRQAPQALLQPTGSNPQQPGNGAPPPASPSPHAPHN